MQKKAELLEVRLVVERALTKEEEERLTEVICAALGIRLRLEFVYFAHEIPRSASGKFEEFISLVQ